jgi:hypothetical protein
MVLLCLDDDRDGDFPDLTLKRDFVILPTGRPVHLDPDSRRRGAPFVIRLPRWRGFDDCGLHEDALVANHYGEFLNRITGAREIAAAPGASVGLTSSKGTQTDPVGQGIAFGERGSLSLRCSTR